MVSQRRSVPVRAFLKALKLTGLGGLRGRRSRSRSKQGETAAGRIERRAGNGPCARADLAGREHSRIESITVLMRRISRAGRASPTLSGSWHSGRSRAERRRGRQRSSASSPGETAGRPPSRRSRTPGARTPHSPGTGRRRAGDRRCHHASGRLQRRRETARRAPRRGRPSTWHGNQPISLHALGKTRAPRALAMSWAPRQIPRTVFPDAMHRAMSLFPAPARGGRLRR